MPPSPAWSELRSFLRRTHNKDVKAWFSDILDDVVYQSDNARYRARQMCLIEANDSQNIALMRMQIFHNMIMEAHKKPDIYGIPIDTYDENVRYSPQIRLYFSQDGSSVAENQTPTRAEISFRLIGETSSSITPTNANTLANKIRSIFITPTPYRWRKGRVKVSYRDKERGYRLLLFAYSEAEAREVITKILEIQSHPFDESYLTVAETRKTYPLTPGTHLVYGKTRQKPQERPIAYVRFRHASLSVWGLPRDVCLVDTTGYYRDALITV